MRHRVGSLLAILAALTVAPGFVEAQPAQDDAVSADRATGGDDAGREGEASEEEKDVTAGEPERAGAAGASAKAVGATEEKRGDGGPKVDANATTAGESRDAGEAAASIGAAKAGSDKPPEGRVGPTLNGYIQPAFGFRARSAAVPRDRLSYGAFPSRAGIMISGTELKYFSYMLHFVLDARSVSALTGASLVDGNGDGTAESLELSRRSITGTIIQEIAIRYRPVEQLTVVAGQLRIPFSLAHRRAYPDLMFATRPGPNAAFLVNADQGAMIMGSFLKEKIRASVGAFDGGSLASSDPRDQTRGLLWAHRVDAEPLGRMPSTENDFERGPLRFGLGYGVLARHAEVFDPGGYQGRTVTDVRFAGSFRMAWRGFYALGEIMRTVRQDALAVRSEQTTGTYAAASYVLPPLGSVALSPLARAGYVASDETYFPRKTLYIDAGIAIYPGATSYDHDAVRVLLAYSGERRITEREDAHGGVMQLQLRF